MSKLSHSESRRAYSWWWDSHISPKNSKWLQENLTDMDSKVKSMIKLIEEDADSFARRAEMFYEKRPELMKLVEEFYRAYRALAERYDHATGELRHAHRTIAKAFPDHQLPFELVEDSPSKSSGHDRDPQTPENKFHVRALFEQDVDLLDKTHGLSESIKKDRVSRVVEQLGKTECEAVDLKNVLTDMWSEKEDVLLKYQQYSEKLSSVDKEFNIAKNDSARLDEKAVRAEIEVQMLKEALTDLLAEKKAGWVKHKDYLDKISNLEKGLNKLTIEAETEARALKDEIFKVELEKESIFNQYTECLGKISVLENIIAVNENKANVLKKKAENAENEVFELKKALNNDVLKLKTAKDEELTEKQVELESLSIRLEDEHFRYTQIEATLQTLQNMHSRSRDDQRALTVELRDVLGKLKDSEANKQFLEDEIRQIRDENRSLSETNVSAAVCMENMENEVLGLREIKERLEREVSHHVDLSDVLHKEILSLKDEINELNRSYRSILGQVEAAGLSPQSFGTKVKCLQDENSKLRRKYESGANENEILSQKLEYMQQLFNKNAVSEISASDLKIKLQRSQEEANVLEKATIVAEKASLLSQLETITETMHKLLEKNAVLESSLLTANVELEGLREKSKGLEEICELLKNERSFLLTERGNLAFKLENVQKRLKIMEKKYIGLEKKYGELEKEKNDVHCQFEELKVSLSVEKQDRTSSKLRSETKLVGLKNKIHLLQEENSKKKKEFEDELQNSQFEISFLQKFIKDMEEKNCSLVNECQKHVEASKLSEKLIFELESESLEQQVESRLLLDEIEWLRLSMYQICKALEPEPDCEYKIENKENIVHRLLGNIKDLKCNIFKHEDEKQLLLVENSVLLTLLEQLESKGIEIELQKVFLENEFKTTGEKLQVAKDEKDKLLELNGRLKSDANDNNTLLKDCVDKLEKEMQGMRQYNVTIKKDNASVKERLLQNEAKLLDTEVKLEAAENLNLKLCLTVDELENDIQESMRMKENLEKNILELSEKNSVQNKEIEGLIRVKTDLASEIGVLRDEIKEKKLREQILSSKLQEKNNEFELWEAKAWSFYFDLQISTVNEILFRDKLQELSGLYRILRDEKASKTSEIQEMEGKFCSMESEISGLKSQINAYAPVVASIKNDITSLERIAIVQTKLKSSLNEPEFAEVDADPRKRTSEILPEDHQSLVSLQSLSMRIRALRKLMEEKTNKLALRRRPSSRKHKKEQHSTDDSENSKPFLCLGRDKHDTPKIQKIKTKPSSEPRNRSTLMNDIPLDRISYSDNLSPKRLRKRANSRVDEQMLELLWDNKRELTIGESLRMSYKMTENDIVYNPFGNAKMGNPDPHSMNLDMEKEFGVDKLEFFPRKSTENQRRILERLSSDAAKLENLQTTVQILRENLATNKKSRKSKNVDLVWEQLLEAEDTVEYLMDLNGRLVMNVENCPSPDRKCSSKLKETVRIQRRKVSEQARKGSERIGRLQLELQKIQYILMKLDEEKKNKGKNMFFRSKSIVLSGKRNKGSLCACFRPSNSENGHSI